MTVWLEPQPVDVPPALQEAVGGHPLVAQTLARRGVLTPDAARAFLDPAAYTPALPTDLPDLEVAVERLRRAIRGGERIAVWGDLDADGQTATALLVEVLRALGAEVIFHVPSRQDGHGVHKPGIDRLIAAGARLILTCDTGVTAHAAVAHANARGAEVIVTDHHVPGEGLPPALAVINPHRLPPGHPLGTLPGVGVAYELARALNPGRGRPRPRPGRTGHGGRRGDPQRRCPLPGAARAGGAAPHRLGPACGRCMRQPSLILKG